MTTRLVKREQNTMRVQQAPGSTSHFSITLGQNGWPDANVQLTSLYYNNNIQINKKHTLVRHWSRLIIISLATRRFSHKKTYIQS